MRNRLKTYNYSKPGVLMLTIGAREGVRLASISRERHTLTKHGEIVAQALIDLPLFAPQIRVGESVIMPDHIHFIVHLHHALPNGKTLQSVIRGFKIGINRRCRGQSLASPVLQEGFYDTIILSREHLKRSERYIADNVRRYRMKKALPDLFRTFSAINAREYSEQYDLSGIGNRFLLDAPLLRQIQFSRSTTEQQWLESKESIEHDVKSGVVFISPFISPCEARAKELILSLGGKCIHVLAEEHRISERYKPAGALFDACCNGQLLELSFHKRGEPYGPPAQFSRARCLEANALCAHLSRGTKCPCSGATAKAPESGHEVPPLRSHRQGS